MALSLAWLACRVGALAAALDGRAGTPELAGLGGILVPVLLNGLAIEGGRGDA
ncbi:MAG TPA: hypothetical protein VNN09_04965 [Candidatus Competibacteraceae bacterium]|nr:hypothetical protein [Candidatus Competibacteraceae bacterium]